MRKPWDKKMSAEKSSENMLKEMWDQQEDFMRLLQKERNFPEFPVDLKTKKGQKFVKDISHDCMHELFEAIHMLKNSKDHRITDLGGIDEDEFKEELSDSLHFFVEVCISAGISYNDIYEAYMKKGKINVERIKNGY